MLTSIDKEINRLAQLNTKNTYILIEANYEHKECIQEMTNSDGYEIKRCRGVWKNSLIFARLNYIHKG